MKGNLIRKRTIILLAVFTTIIAVTTGCSIESKINKGYKYIEEDEFEKAVLVFKEVLEKDEEKIEAEIGLSKAYMGLEKYKKAERYIRKALDIDEKDADSWELLLEILVEMEEDDTEIIDVYNEAYDKTGKKGFLDDLNDYLKEIDEKKYKETVRAMSNDKGLLVKFEENIPTILYKQSYDFNDNQYINIDLNNDGIEEYIEVGMDSPNGMKVLIVQDQQGYNLLSDMTASSYPFFGEYGDLSEDLYIQVSFVDFNDDHNLEIIIAIGDNESQLAVSIIENRLSDYYISPYLEIGYFEGEDSILITKDKIARLPIHTDKTVDEYYYNPTIGAITNIEQSGTYLFVDQLIGYYNIHKKGRLVPIQNEDEMLNFLYNNTWVYEDNTNFFLNFEENKMISGDTGTWNVFTYDSIDINLNEKYIILHFTLSESYTDEEQDAVIENIDVNVKLVFGEGPLQIIYNHDIEGEQVISNWYIKN